MSTEHEIKTLEEAKQNILASIEEEKQKQALYDTLLQFKKSRAYKTIIEDLYEKEYLNGAVIALARLAHDPNRSNAVVEGIKSVSHFKDFLGSIESNGLNASENIKVLQEDLETTEENIDLLRGTHV